MKIKGKVAKYTQSIKEKLNETIEKSEVIRNIFIKFLVIFKSQKLFLNYLKLLKQTKK